MGSSVPVIFLAVAAFLLNVVLSRIVTGQREQIGALKALGYGNWRIGSHYAELVIAVVVLGGAIGIALGRLVRRRAGRDLRAVLPLPRSVVCAARRHHRHRARHQHDRRLHRRDGGVAPRGRAEPADAMRPVAPPRYRMGIVAGSFLGKLLSPQARMIIRNLGRAPIRAALGSLGIALAIAIQIMGSFSYDALDFLMDLQFQRVQRYDVEVAFGHAIGDDALHDLANIPGVLEVEGTRALPVRLRVGEQHYETAVVAMPPDPRLRRLLDPSFHALPMPEQGVLLTDVLAQRFGLRVGITAARSARGPPTDPFGRARRHQPRADGPVGVHAQRRARDHARRGAARHRGAVAGRPTPARRALHPTQVAAGGRRGHPAHGRLRHLQRDLGPPADW